jgi:hypothetical protein
MFFVVRFGFVGIPFVVHRSKLYAQ